MTKSRGIRTVKPGSMPTPLQDKILEALELGPADLFVVARRVDRVYDTVRQSMLKLLKDQMVHVAEYRRTGSRGPVTKVFAVGRGDGTVPKMPDKMDDAARARAYRKKLRAAKSYVGSKVLSVSVEK